MQEIFIQLKPCDKDYGPTAQRPDLDEELMGNESKEFLLSLTKTPAQIKDIERETVKQKCG